MKQSFQTKLNSSALNVKDVDTTGRVITVYYSAFNNVDRDNDAIVKGAFTKTVKEQGPAGRNEIWHLIGHDPTKHVAKPFEIGEDSYGLLARVKIPNTTLGNDTLELYREGHYKHHSIGFRTIRQVKRADHNEIQEVALFEGSSVVWAANPSAITVGIKSMTKQEVLTDFDLTIKSLRNGTFSDATFSLLEIKLRQLHQALIDTTPAASAPGPDKELTAKQEQIRAINALFKKV